jgi:hypothetical protein
VRPARSLAGYSTRLDRLTLRTRIALLVANLLDAVAPSPAPADLKPITEQPAAARTVRASLRWSARPR